MNRASFSTISFICRNPAMSVIGYRAPHILNSSKASLRLPLSPRIDQNLHNAGAIIKCRHVERRPLRKRRSFISAIRVNVRSSFDENFYGFNSVIIYRMAEHSLGVAPRIGVRARVDENSYYFGPIVK